MENICLDKMLPKYRVLYDFLNKYGYLYPEDELRFLKKHLLTDMNLARRDKEIPSIVIQVYKYLRVCPEATKIYDDHLNEIKKHFLLSRNICEVGGGRLPAFANMVAEEQLNIGKGTITVYDPGLVFLEPMHSNISLSKDYFTKDTDVSKFDLLIGIHPCEATLDIIENALKNDKDFYLAMCGCAHDQNGDFRRENGYRLTSTKYQQNVIEKARMLAEKYGDRKIEVSELDRKTYKYPIIIGKIRT